MSKPGFYFQPDDSNEEMPRSFSDGTLIPYCEKHDTPAEVMDCACNDPNRGCKLDPCSCQCHRGPWCAECNGE